MRTIKKSLLAISTAGALITASSAAFALDNLTTMEKMVHRRAVEAAVWAMPIMNVEAMRRGHFDIEGDFNTVYYGSKIQNWKTQTTTNNNTTPYVMSFWDTKKDGPIVVEIPAQENGVALFGTLMDVWQRPLEDIGARGKDRGRGAKYLIVPPGYQGEHPKGYFLLEQSTNMGYTLIRPIIKNASDENLKNAEALVKKIKVYPLSQVDNKTKYVDVYDKHIDGVAHFDASYYEQLNNVIQHEVIEEKDLAMMGLLHEIGITKGVDYQITPRRKDIFADAAKEAHEFLIERYFNSGLTAPFYGGDSKWSVLVPQATVDTDFSYEYPNYLDIDARAGVFYAMFTSVKNWNFYDAPTFYLLGNQDNDSQQLNGSHNYKLTVPKDVPIKHFWSAIAYTVEDATWFDNQPKAGVASSDKGLVTNPDGTVDIYMGPEAPKGKEANWIPTTEGKDYFIYFRVYGPTQPFFRKEWVLNNIEKI